MCFNAMARGYSKTKHKHQKNDNNGTETIQAELTNGAKLIETFQALSFNARICKYAYLLYHVYIYIGGWCCALNHAMDVVSTTKVHRIT